MLITKQWLLSNSEKFWCDLLMIIHAASPYFGRLDWKLRPNISIQPFPRLHWPLESLRATIRNIPDSFNEGQLARRLMSVLFYVATDYDRSRIIIPEYEYNEQERELMQEQGLERLPRYPGYFVSLVPFHCQDSYRPLKLEEIQAEDIKEFKQKVKLVGSSHSECSEQLLAGYRNLKDYYRERENQVKEKLTTWTQLITNRHV